MGHDRLDDDWVSEEIKRVLIRRLMLASGIKESEARALVDRGATDWTSIVREARKARKKPRASD